MFDLEPDLIITIPAKTELLKMVVELTKHIVVILDFPVREVQKIALAVDEAITNVIKHSYEYSSDQDITIEFFTSARGLKIRIIFSGIPPIMARTEVNLGQMIKEKRKGGLGVQLMRKIMDSVEYVSQDGLNYCEMVKWKQKESVV